MGGAPPTCREQVALLRIIAGSWGRHGEFLLESHAAQQHSRGTPGPLPPHWAAGSAPGRAAQPASCAEVTTPRSWRPLWLRLLREGSGVGCGEGSSAAGQPPWSGKRGRG